MTDRDLRDLFQSAASDLDHHRPAHHDLSAIDRAWRDGTRRRVAARAAVVGSIAATVAVVAGVAMLDEPFDRAAPGSPDDRISSPTSTPSPPSQGPPVAERAGDYEGAHVWWAPSAADEPSLPPLADNPLPPAIDLATAEVGDVGEPVLALLSGRGVRAFALTASQRLVEIDTSRLDPVTDEAGNGRSPLSPYSLSADRRRAFFIQRSSLEVLDFETGEWTSMDTPDWLAEGARWVLPDAIWVPESLGEDSKGTAHRLDGSSSSVDVDWVQGWTGPDDEPWGPVASSREGTAQAAFVRGPIDGGSVSNPQAVMVDRDGGRSVLVLDFGRAGQGTRSKGCCVALGWLDADTVLFGSQSTEGQRILAWHVDTPDVRRVADILGPGRITSLADLSTTIG